MSKITFRFNFSEEIENELINFSKIHQYDNCKDFKEYWKKWTEENILIIKSEEERINLLGYKGNIIDKMYIATRYYFRKKINKKQEIKKRRVYKSCSEELLIEMDNQITRQMMNDNYKPSLGYINFCENNISLLEEEISKMLLNELTKEEIIFKIKKTYKNRYFNLSKNKE